MTRNTTVKSPARATNTLNPLAGVGVGGGVREDDDTGVIISDGVSGGRVVGRSVGGTDAVTKMVPGSSSSGSCG